MDRRDFLLRHLHARPPRPEANGAARPSTGLEPYVPGTSAPWDALRAGHLLRRTTFLPRWGDITTLLDLSPGEAVDLLLGTPSTPSAPAMADHVTESLDGLDITYQNIVRGQWRADFRALQEWYAEVMVDAPPSIVEKLVGFYSNHFATEFVVDLDFVLAPLLYRQNEMFRQKGLGAYDEMMVAITLDGAMLTYLGGNINVQGKPNENYAREMLELFTTGLGHYTEGDIKEAARILTGWKIARYSDEAAPNGIFNTWFLPGDHDTAAKQFLGTSFPARDGDSNTEFLVRRDEIERMIGAIFEKRPEAIARFMSEKLYRFFVYSNPSGNDFGVIDGMAQIFLQNDFRIEPVLSTLFRSAHFFDNLNIGAQIKTPAEFTAGLARQIATPQEMVDGMNEMEMVLFDPPNVSGWPGYRDWMTTNTYPIRSEMARGTITSMSDDATIGMIESFPEFDDVHTLVESVGALLLPRPMSDGRRASLEAILLQGAPDYEWSTIMESPATAALRFRDMLLRISELPDFHLC